MLIAHTSDWHLGQNLYDHSRLEEQKLFLSWLAKLLEERHVDVLIVSGDIYDTAMPPNAARKLYYDFLKTMRDLPGGICRSVFLTGGNHDSPAVLNASAEYLACDHIHVLGRAPESLKDEVFFVQDDDGRPALCVCAVPYLREADLDRSFFGSDPGKRSGEIAAAVLAHYQGVRQQAREMMKDKGCSVPLVGMGHLFARGVSLEMDKDGEGQIVVGTLGEIDAGALSQSFDYLALGHIHSGRCVAGCDHMRYSGSPLSLDFGEYQPEKKILLVECRDDEAAELSPASGWRGSLKIEEVPVPIFRPMRQLKGSSLDELADRLTSLAEGYAKAAEDAESAGKTPSLLPWLIVDYTGETEPPLDWRENLIACAVQPGASEPSCQLLALRDFSPRLVTWTDRSVTDLKTMQPEDVFELLLY